MDEKTYKHKDFDYLFNASPTFESTATGSLTIRGGNDSDSQDSNIDNFNRPTFYEQQPKTSKNNNRQCDPQNENGFLLQYETI